MPSPMKFWVLIGPVRNIYTPSYGHYSQAALEWMFPDLEPVEAFDTFDEAERFATEMEAVVLA